MKIKVGDKIFAKYYEPIVDIYDSTQKEMLKVGSRFEFEHLVILKDGMKVFIIPETGLGHSIKYDIFFEVFKVSENQNAI